MRQPLPEFASTSTGARASRAPRPRIGSAARVAVARRARQRHLRGLTSYETVLDTERTVPSVEDSPKIARAEHASGLIGLHKALGGGWTPGEGQGTSVVRRSENS